MKGRKTKALIAGLVALCVASMSLLGIIWHREGYTRKVLIKLGLTTEKDPGRDHNALLSWQASLESMNYKADVAFFGDSITKNNRWQDYFPGIAVCNLGYSGDTVAGLLERTGMVQAVNPDKVFILIGVNNMGKGRYLENLSQGYRQLIAQLQSGLPQAQLFMVSILPTCPPSDLSNQQILEANRMIQQLAQELDIPYIDTHSQFADEQGQLAQAYSKDGVHLSQQGKDLLAQCLAPYVGDGAYVPHPGAGEQAQD